MPKKFRGKSTAGAKAKEQKKQSAAVKAQAAKIQKERELDAKWKVGSNVKGERRQQEEEEKRREKQAKQEMKKLLQAEEEAELAAMKAPKGKRRKAQLKNKHKTIDFGKLDSAAKKKKKKFGVTKKKKSSSKRVVKQTKLEPNLNKKRSQDLENGNATGIDAALSVMSIGSFSSGTPERHPERRVKAAFKAYEEREIAKLRDENPGLKRSQLKELVFKKWKKSPENPMNQAHMEYNSKD